MLSLNRIVMSFKYLQSQVIHAQIEFVILRKGSLNSVFFYNCLGYNGIGLRKNSLQLN